MRDQTFTLDATLEADTLSLGRMGLCRVLLMNDMRFPWLILVPEKPGLQELIDLPASERAVLIEEIAMASEALKSAFSPDKLNVAALGNRVKQLHIHVIARFVSDEAWPAPVFGVGTAVPFPPHMQGMLSDKLSAAMGLESL